MSQDPALHDLVLAVLTDGWSRWGMPTEDLPVILDAALAEPDNATVAAQRVAPYLVAREGVFGKAYAEARASKFDEFAALVRPSVQPGLVCDMGAGDTQLVARIAATCEPGSRFVATDIMGEPTADGDVSFVVQPAPDRLPLADGSAANVIATGMLHHMSPEVRAALLADVRRSLHPEGTLVMLEDTYPAEPWAARSPADARFQDLDDRGRWGFLAVTDWWGNRVMKNLPEVPLPCTFLDLAQWRPVLAEAGLRIRSVDYLGVVDCGGHMATPRALIVAERGG